MEYSKDFRFTDSNAQFETQEFKEAAAKAVVKFQNDYRDSTSGDLQTFILGFRAAWLAKPETIEVLPQSIQEALNSGDGTYKP